MSHRAAFDQPYGTYPFAVLDPALATQTYFVTTHPRAHNRTFNSSSPFHKTVWLGFFACALLLTMMLCTFLSEQRIEFHLNLISIYIIEMLGSIKKKKSESISNNSVFTYLHMLWHVLIFMSIFYYNVKLHSQLISQDFEKVPMNPFDLSFPEAKVRWPYTSQSFSSKLNVKIKLV